MNIDAIVLAGGEANRVDPSLSGPKSLIEIAGRPMIGYVIDALRGCPDLGKILIALPHGADPRKFDQLADLMVEGTSDVVDAITKSIKKINEIGDKADENGYVLLVSSDAPMIHSEAINEFIGKCRREQAEVYYSIIHKEATEAVFPGTSRTYLHLKDGSFTGGNVHLMGKSAFLRNTEMGARLFNLRKNPVSILSLLGVGFVLKYITGRLDIETLEAKAKQLLGAKVKAIVTSYPELGVDVDKREDLELAQAYLGDK